MIPAHGLVPPTLSIKDLKQQEFSETRQHNIQDVPSLAPKVIIELQCRFDENSSLIICDNTWSVSFLQLLGSSEENNAVPSNFQEVAACSRTLTPQELYRVELG